MNQINLGLACDAAAKDIKENSEFIANQDDISDIIYKHMREALYAEQERNK